MRDGLPALTEREKEMLRLLLAGHDAKSVARAQGLSVHTVNERLRDARRKLGAASSREAARLLAAAERGAPDSLGDEDLGVAPDAGAAAPSDRPNPPDRPRRAAHRLAWFGGGMLVMSLVVAAAMLSLAYSGTDPSGGGGAQGSAASVPAAAERDPVLAGAARNWLALLDGRRWEESWRAAGAIFTSQATAAQWAGIAEAARGPLGPVSRRTVQVAARTATLPGMPPGEYGVVEFATAFARGPGSVERVILVRERGRWRVIGYFIR